ncbi:MAG: DUF1573 domain-containing protein [Paludibacteraceae bacterium]|nr:DUF1573 domain-containing protein [Paludibacteraceae bacterium]
MKKILSIAAFTCIAMLALGQDPVITFTKTTHDFGKINEADGRVTTIFEFKNEGMTPLVLTNVRASCGCTTPKWTHEPIEPGQIGQITVTYNPSGRPGRFQKTVTVTSNATVATTKLYIKGEVIPKPAKPIDQYPIKMGELSLKRRTVSYGTVIQGTNKVLEVEYTNLTDQPITVDLLIREQDSYFKPNVTLKTVAPKETGKFQFALQSDEAPLLGPINVKAYVMINGKRNISDTYAITLSANIREDFSKMTIEERQQAPILEAQREINLGELVAGKKSTHKISIGNAGVNPLMIRRLISNDQQLLLTAPKSAIRGGKKADIKLEITPKATDEPAQYSRSITIITNDPNTPIINVKLNWTVVK